MNQWQERPATKQDTMVVPDSRGSWETYKRKSAYICPAGRYFRQEIQYIAFYVSRTIQRQVPRITQVINPVTWTPEHATELEASTSQDDKKVADLIKWTLSEEGERILGSNFQGSRQMKVVLGSVIGCKQFSCSGDAVWRLIMGCRRMLGVEDRAAIMAGVNAGLSQVRIAHLIGRSPSVVCREIARHTGPDGEYRAEEAGKAAQAARRRPKKRLLDCDEILRDRVIADLSQGHTPRQISGRLRAEACGTLPSMDTSPDAQGHTISHEAIYTWIYAHPKKTLIEHGFACPRAGGCARNPRRAGANPPSLGCG